MRQMLSLAVAMFLVAISSTADVVTLKNGEKLVGDWVSVHGGSLTFQSETLGQVTIPLTKVQSFSTSKSVVVIRKDHSTVSGRLELLPSGSWQVTHNGSTQVIPAASIETIMQQTAYTTLVEHKAAPWQDWKGSANLGYNLQRGDQQTGALSANVAATRERPEAPIFVRHFRTNYSLLMLFSKAQQNGALIRSNTITSLLRQDYLFAADDFAFVSCELDHIQAQGLYLRQTYGGGFGRDLVHSSRLIFSTLGGLTFVSEKFYTGGPARQSAEVLVGEKLSAILSKRIQFNHYLDFYPNVTNTGNYHFDTTSSLNFKLNSRLVANISFVDNYLSDPALGSHKNNVALTTGIGVTF